jgi:hypothetical protein
MRFKQERANIVVITIDIFIRETKPTWKLLQKLRGASLYFPVEKIEVLS